MEANARLQQLLRDFPLPSGCSDLEEFSEAVSVGALDEIHLAGIVARVDGSAITGSAAAHGEVPWARAYFELLERLSLTRAMSQSVPLQLRDASGEPLGEVSVQEVFPPSSQPDKWCFARSNGAAIAPTWEQACDRALGEAVERDVVLRSWYRVLPLAPLPAPLAAQWASLQELYELELRQAARMGYVVTVGVGYPRKADIPTCLAFGARRDADASNVAAHAEFLQRLGFLWGEEIPEEEPELTPDASYHQEYYLWPPASEHLRRWLGTAPTGATAVPRGGPRGFVDLTPPHLLGKLAVARVLHPELWPLAFGDGWPQPSSGVAVHAIHPIA